MASAVSIALLANGFDVKWVMSQVGHADSKMTLDVYAQLEQRADRSRGTSFDALLRPADGQRDDVDWATLGHDAPKSNSTHHRDQRKAPQKAALCRHFSSGETRTRTGDTTILVVRSPRPNQGDLQVIPAFLGNAAGVRAFLDFASVSMTLRPTKAAVGPFVAPRLLT
jgi:hypothetical protein